MKRTDPGYWDWRKNPHRRKKISSPEKLWLLACDYFSYVDKNPWVKKIPIKSGNLAGTVMTHSAIRPYTWDGFNDFVSAKGIISDLDDYVYNPSGTYDDYQPVIKKIQNIIRDRKYTGAVVGSFNAGIIIRDLGLVDKTETKHGIEQPLFGPDDE